MPGQNVPVLRNPLAEINSDSPHGQIVIAGRRKIVNPGTQRMRETIAQQQPPSNSLACCWSTMLLMSMLSLEERLA